LHKIQEVLNFDEVSVINISSWGCAFYVCQRNVYVPQGYKAISLCLLLELL
jgi:hypothetical protein